MKQSIKEVMGHRAVLKWSMEKLIEILNPKIRGWHNYYGVKTAKRWLNSIDWYVIRRYNIWYNKKHQKRNHMRKVGAVCRKLCDLGLERLAA
jgi:RNA-directed DNA polymerase